MKQVPGFTLIELLVVITIIVVLLALLTPALDRAIYQAELTVCSANQAGAARGGLTYAAAHKRRYPHRQPVDDKTGDYQTHELVNGNATAGVRGFDYRPILASMFSLNRMLTDPLCEDVDLESDRGGGAVDIVQASYDIWFGWQYAGHRRMARIGDTFTWTDDQAVPWNNNTGQPRTGHFTALISDRHHINYNTQVQASHPDISGVMTSRAYQDSRQNPWVPAFTLTYAIWLSTATGEHDGIDMNYAFQDGSATRLDLVQPYDERVFPVPQRLGNGNPPNDLMLKASR